MKPPAGVRPPLRAAAALALAMGALPAAAPAQEEPGRAIFVAKGCALCHEERAVLQAPHLSRLRRGRTLFELGEAMWNHAPMMWANLAEPGLGWPRLTPHELIEVARYLNGAAPADPPPSTARGQLVLLEKGCLECHTGDGRGPKGAKDLVRQVRHASDEAWIAALWNSAPAMLNLHAERRLAYPALEAGDLRDLVGFLRQSGRPRSPRAAANLRAPSAGRLVGGGETGESGAKEGEEPRRTEEDEVMKGKFWVWAAALGLALPAAAWGATPAAKVEPLTIKFAHAGSLTHPYSVGVQKLAPILERRSGGAIKLQVFCCAQLGSERELAEGARLGTIHMVSVAGEGALPAWVPELQVFGLPFVIRDRAHVYKVLEGPIGKELEAKLAAQGFQVLGWWELGFRNMTTRNKPIRAPEDLRGLKMRVQEAKVWLGFMRALGAIPTPIPFGELYSALQQGVVDGQENPIVTIVSMKFYEVQRHVGLTEHTYTALPVMASKKWWDGLTAAQRQVIAEAVREAVPEQRRTVAGQVDEGVKFLRAQGINITEVEKAKFVEATRDVPALVADQVPPDLVQRVRDTR